jgi:uncharacterized protein with HEPN domain
MSGVRLADYLQHMRQAATEACTFVEGLGKDDFIADRRTQRAVVMSLIIIGEAATKILDRHRAFAEQHGEIEWRGMKGMRNRIAHGYFDINLDTVWDTVQTDLPLLLRQLERFPLRSRRSHRERCSWRIVGV